MMLLLHSKPFAAMNRLEMSMHPICLHLLHFSFPITDMVTLWLFWDSPPCGLLVTSYITSLAGTDTLQS